MTDSTVAAHAPTALSPDAATAVEIVVPVHDEERGLEASIRALHRYLTERFTVPWAITIADNASTDGTWAIAQPARRRARRRARPAPRREGPRAAPCARRGRASTARVVAYMDVDLSTDLDALLPLVAPLLSGPQRRRHRHPPGVERTRRARPEARARSRAATT